MRLRKTQIAWLAGLIDGEGCIYFNLRGDMKHVMRISHRTGEEVSYGPYSIVYTSVRVAMADEMTIRYVEQLMRAIVPYPDGVHMYKEKRRTPRCRPLWHSDVNNRRNTYALLCTVRPYLVTKALEADLSLDFLQRAVSTDRYKMMDRDLLLARLAKQLRHGCGEARTQALVILGQVTPSQAAEGIGSAEGLETRSVSPNNNPTHERPAPHLALVQEGEDIVQAQSESSGVGINSRRRHRKAT